MKDILTELHTPCLMQCGFYPDDDHGPYNREGVCFSVLPEKGHARYWTYTRDNLFSISIQDFVFYEDLFLEFQQPKYLSFNYYDSVSGEEFNPYKRLSCGCIRVHIGSNNLYRASQLSQKHSHSLDGY
ncbi:hypothetical protein [Brevibacillus porteri]|uniref:hypothetical protein n=1 Tax=Brevibacillus porteri TaxID=2126350 RepID=UPI00363E28C7